ncbi:MAG: hypothetical protein IJV48_05320 [Ruminococcus sp.]|nr:hypothetical protein [Ruminococcus sp.]
MKNKIDRTQTGTKMLSTRMIAMVLCCVMLLTAIGSGSVLSALAVTKTDDAADESAAVETVDVEEADGTSFADVYDTEETMLSLAKKDSDLADTGAGVDLSSTALDSGDGIHLGIGTSTTSWHGMGTSAYEFTLSATTTIYYTFSCSGGNFGKGNQGTPSDSSQESYTWYANKGDSTQFSVSLPAGTYKFQLIGIQSNNANCLEYKFWKTSSGGGGDDPEPSSDYIYFNNSGTNWSKVYAYLYTSSYWDKEKGSGSSGRDNGVEMEYDSALGLYKTSISDSITHVVFLRDEQNGYNNFWQTEAAYIELSETYANDSKFSASTPVYVPVTTNPTTTNSTKYYDTADTNKGSWVAATNPVAASLTISASPTELSAVGQTSTVTVTATDIASGVTNLTYTIYDRDNDSVVDSRAVTNGSTSVTFTVTPNARVKSYYASVKPTSATQQAQYDEVWTSADATISNSADEYIPRYTVTFSSNNNSYGAVTAKDGSGNTITSGASVKEGDSVTFTATPTTGNVFTSWSAFDTTATSVTRVIRADTTVVGNFGPKGYKLLAGASVTQNMRELSNGTYISEALTSDNWFIIVRNATGERSKGSASPQALATDGTKYDVTWMTGTTWSDSNTYKKASGTHYVVYDPATNKVWITTDKDDLYGVTVVAKDGTIRYGYKTYNTDYTSAFGDTTVELVSPSSITGTVDNNAYDGQAVAYNLTANDVRNGVKLKIKTQTKSAYVNNGYYVKGFVVSGYEESFSVLWQEFDGEGAEQATYDDRDWIHSGYNEFELTIDGYPEKNIEITPVYAVIETESGDNIRFYVEGFAGDVYKNWGGTLAIDAYNTSGDRIFGEYPGQPMINYNGRYVVDLPRTGVTGITLNNYVWDRIHSNLFYGTTGTSTGHESTVQANNYQTYDFNDFTYLKQRMDASGEDEDMIFSFRYRRNDSYNTKATSQLGKSTYYVNSDNASATRDYDYRKGFNTIDPNDSIYQWENLTDFYGNRVDIFGDYVDTKDSSGTVTNPKANYNPIRIVSNGYDYNEAGKYATAWAVYKPVDASGNLKYEGDYDHYELFEVYGGQGKSTYGSSSYLVNPTWTTNLRDKYDYAYANDSSKTHSGASFIFDLAEVPTVISYEFEVKDGFSNLNLESASDDGQPGYRSDGRWFTTSSDQLLTAHTIIEYAEKDDDSLYHRDYYQGNGIDYTSASGYDPSVHTGLATGLQAYFDNSNEVTYQGQSYQNTSGYTEASAISDGEHVFKLKAVNDPNGEYVFKGWYMYTNGKYSLVSRDNIYDSEATANDVYVARYYKIPSGTLTISHALDPASTGTGTCKVKVEVVDGNNNTVFSEGFTEGKAITLGSSIIRSDRTAYTIKITLETNVGDFSKFNKFWLNYMGMTTDLGSGHTPPDEATWNQTVSDGQKTYTFTYNFSVSKLFDSSTGEQRYKSLPFYSLIDKPEFNYELEFKYPAYNKSFGNQSFTVKGYFTDDELEQYMVYNNGELSFNADAYSSDTIKRTFINSHAPYEDNFQKTMMYNTYTIPSRTWVAETATFKLSIELEQEQEKLNVTFHLPYSPTDRKTFDPTVNSSDSKVYYQEPQDYVPVPDIYGRDWYTRTGRVIPDESKTADTSFVKAPLILADSSGADKYYFLYWSVHTVAQYNQESVEYTRCYDPEFNLALFQDCIIQPIYGNAFPGDMPSPPSTWDDYTRFDPDVQRNLDSSNGITITFLENSRNQYNLGNFGDASTAATAMADSRKGGGDRIYSDFLISYNNIAGNVTLKDLDANTKKAGLIIEAVGTMEYKAGTEEYETSAEYYRNKYGTTISEATMTKLTSLINDTSQSGFAKSEFDVTSLDNKNRIQYYYSLANKRHTESTTQYELTDDLTNKYKYFRAYAYIYDVNDKANTIHISPTPVYFTIYDMATIENGSFID